jgi:hypothetical protein
MDVPQSIWSLTEGYLDGFLFLAKFSNHLSKYFGGMIAGSHCKNMFRFVRNKFPAAFQRGLTVSYSHQQGMRVPGGLHPLQKFALSGMGLLKKKNLDTWAPLPEILTHQPSA